MWQWAVLSHTWPQLTVLIGYGLSLGQSSSYQKKNSIGFHLIASVLGTQLYSVVGCSNLLSGLCPSLSAPLSAIDNDVVYL